jgi:hypothetical protein
MTQILGPTEGSPAGSPTELNPYFAPNTSFDAAQAPVSAETFEMPGQRMDSGWFSVPVQAEMAGTPSDGEEEQPAWPTDKDPEVFFARVSDGIGRIGSADAVTVETPDTADNTKAEEDTLIIPPVSTPIFDDVVANRLAKEIESDAKAADEGVPADTSVDKTATQAKPLWPVGSDAIKGPVHPVDEPTLVIPELEPITEAFPVPGPPQPFEEDRPPLPRRQRENPDTMHQQLATKHRGRLALGIVSNVQEARVPGANLVQLHAFTERPSRTLTEADRLEPGLNYDLEKTVRINMARLAQPALHDVSVETMRTVAPAPEHTIPELSVEYTQPQPTRLRKFMRAARTLWNDLHPRKYLQTYDINRILTR